MRLDKFKDFFKKISSPGDIQTPEKFYKKFH